MSETNKPKYSWQTKFSVIGGSAIISAIGSVFISLLILMIGFGEGGESLLYGVIIGFPIGFLVGGAMAMWLLGKQIPIWRVIVVSMLVAILTSSLLLVGFFLLDRMKFGFT